MFKQIKAHAVQDRLVCLILCDFKYTRSVATLSCMLHVLSLMPPCTGGISMKTVTQYSHIFHKVWLVCFVYTALTDISTKKPVLCKVYTDVGGIK